VRCGGGGGPGEKKNIGGRELGARGWGEGRVAQELLQDCSRKRRGEEMGKAGGKNDDSRVGSRPRGQGPATDYHKDIRD